MGTNSRQRHAAKRRRRRDRGQGRRSTRLGPPPNTSGFDWDQAYQSVSAEGLCSSALIEIGVRPSAAVGYARLFLSPDSPIPPPVMIGAIEDRARAAVTTVVRNGWLPSDLAEMTNRWLTASHLPTLVALLSAEADRHPTDRVAPAWRDDLAGLGLATAVNAWSVTGLELLLGLLALSRTLPQIPTLIPAPGAVAGIPEQTGIDPKLLSKARSLLAKAESTEFPEEAEALSAKAQELISRYALDRLTLTEPGARDDHQVTTVRLWIDPPYLRAKAMLIGAVARANRCRSVASLELGFSTIVGDGADVEAVELLSTSLLVQASAVMLGHGSVVDGYGTSRTRSFRQSFLVSFAIRIGERLEAATERATAETGRAGELVPLLRRQAERVDAAVEAMFPDLTSFGPSVSNGFGWAAGRAAADLARLDVRAQVRSGVA
jgi:hypothetical protein